MRFYRLDLNLLIVMGVLLKERNVSKAALILNVTQPAISNSLSRLREHFDDPLFVQSGREMMPTDLALRLEASINHFLNDAKVIAEARSGFDPATSSRHFSIAVSDYEANVLMPTVARRIEALAPNISLVLRQTVKAGELDSPHISDILERRGIDCVILPKQLSSASFPQLSLYQETFCCIASSDNNLIGESLSLEQYLSMSHVVAEFTDKRTPTYHMAELKNAGHNIHTAISVEHFTLIPRYIIGTQRIATMHSSLAHHMAEFYPIKIYPTPIPLPSLELVMQWRQHIENDLGLQWLIEQIQIAIEYFSVPK